MILRRFSLLVLVIVLLFSCSGIQSNPDKTLVSWVQLKDMDVLGGSVITVQSGEHYDGIVFSGEEGGKWSVISDRIGPPVEDLSSNYQERKSGELVQIAAVFQGSEVRLYYNTELYSRSEIRNIDLLNNKNDFVLFGLSHAGGEEWISSEIEDARIYSRPLSIDELKTLKPNVQSEFQPYAWWDFEGDDVKERMGVYANHDKGEDDLALENGKLILSKWGVLISARKYIPETPKWPKNPPEDWMTYHLAHPGPGVGEPGDPNPAYFYKGRYHLHYIYRNQYGFAYAHVSSKDMVRWKWHPTVLIPPFTGHGMFSGTGFFTLEGQPAMIYHGVGSGHNQVTLALDDNLDKWTKPVPALALDENEEPVEDMYYWDPDCWIIDKTYYALSGGKDPELMKSDDLKTWKYLGKVLHAAYPDDLGVGRDEDISCANMFRIGNKWMLLCISHRLGCRYFLGDFKDEKYLPESHHRMNWVNTDWENDHGGSLVYFAPESMLSDDGRRVMWAWLMAEIAPSAVQSLPRELELPDDGILRIRPLKELESLRYNQWVKTNIKVKKGDSYHLEGITGNAVELAVQLSAPLPKEFEMNLLGDENGKEGMRISFGAGQKSLSIGTINPPFELEEGEDLTMRIFIDKNLVEVFANDRQAAAVAHDHIRQNPNITISSNGDLMMKEIKAWNMKSIY